MPASQIRQKRPKAKAATAIARAPSARSVAREVVARMEQLVTMRPEVVVSAFRFALPKRESGKVIDIAKLIAGLGSVKTRPGRNATAMGKTAADALTAKAIEARSALLASGQVVPSKDICATLSFTRQALSRAVKEHRMFSVDVGGDRLYPAFYADTGLDRQQLESVAKELGSLPGWSKLQFFTTPKASLGGATPLDALKDGRFNEARRAAIGFADR